MIAELSERIRERFGEVLVAREEVSIIVDRDDLLETLTTLRDARTDSPSRNWIVVAPL